MNQYTEKVAAGLRRMHKKPDAFLFCDGETAYDEPTACGIPVYHSVFVNNSQTDEDVPFIPIWAREGDYAVDRKRFNDGFVEVGNGRK